MEAKDQIRRKMGTAPGFAAFCALIEYSEADVVNTLVTRFDTPREEAERIVEAAFQKHAAEQAEVAVQMHMQG